MKSMCQDARRNSPSVADCSPTSSCMRDDVADRVVLDGRAARRRRAGRRRASSRASSSSGGRSRLPTWSARNGGLVRSGHRDSSRYAVVARAVMRTRWHTTMRTPSSPSSTAVADLVHDGDTVALEGFTHLIPVAAGHEIIRQRRRDLTLVRMTPDIVYDQLIGAGCARKLVFSWGGNPGVGSLHRFRDAVQNGWPRAAGDRGAQPRRAWPTATSPAPPACRSRCCAATAAPTCPSTPRHDQADHLPVHRRGADRGAGARPRRRRSSTRSGPTARATCSCGGITGVQKEAVLGRQALARHGRGDRRRARAAARRGRAAELGRRPAWPRCRGGAHPSYAHGLLRPRQRLLPRVGRASAKDRERFERVAASTQVCQHELHDRRDDDRRRRARAARRRRLLRRHRAAEHRPPTSPGARTRPDLVLIYESGAIGAKPTRLPLSIGDGDAGRDRRRRRQRRPRSSTTGCSRAGSTSASSARRRSTASRNINTTVIGDDYDAPEGAAARRRRRAGDRRLVRRGRS